MKSTEWNDIETALRKQDSPRSSRDSEEFWAEFRARAELTGQDQTPVLVMGQARVWGSALAAAATVALLAAGLFFTMRPPAQDMTAMYPVTNLTVADPSIGVTFLSSGTESGTIIWITDYGSESDADAPSDTPETSAAPDASTPSISPTSTQ